MKKIIYCLLVVVMLSACGGTKNSDTKLDTKQETAPRREGEKRVGDIIMVDGEFGVIFAVTTDGQHGKAMSVLETRCDWYTAKTWCANYGKGWRLPTIDELLVIDRNKSAINSVLSANGYATLKEDQCDAYWSSEDAMSKSGACIVRLGSGFTCGNPKDDFDNYVRAVSVF